jgi:hypothetical protein
MNEWLNSAQAAARAGRHPNTVRLAAEEGVLHGHQSGRKGRWAFKESAVDAWVQGADGRTVCGCQHLRLAQRRRSA